MERKLLLLADAGVDLNERQHPEKTPSVRSEAERDRDRVLYSSAFQRLGQVTQVTASEEGLSFHSRLTHSLKVAQFARRLAERLKRDYAERPELYPGAAGRAVEALDPDAAETAGLAHDLGHPPFGHLAEEALNEAIADGFEGNAQSFRIVTRLALRHPAYLGLNLTRRTLNGVLKYPWPHDVEDTDGTNKWNYYTSDAEAFSWARGGVAGRERTLEAEIMDWADDVTYAIHDLEDFYRAGLVPLDRLTAGTRRKPSVELEDFIAYLEEKAKTTSVAAKWKASAKQLFGSSLSNTVDAPYSGTETQRIGLRAAGSGLIHRYLSGPTVLEKDGEAYFAVAESLRHQVDVLKKLIWFYVIERPTLGILQAGQTRTIVGLHKAYTAAIQAKDDRLFPPLVAGRIASARAAGTSTDRIVVDYIASLTEESAASVYRRLNGVANGSIADAAGRLT